MMVDQRNNIICHTRVSKRAKNMSLRVHHDGRCEVVLPHGKSVSPASVHAFVRKHHEWIIRQVLKGRRNKDKIALVHQGVPKRTISEETARLVDELVLKYHHIYPFDVQQVRVREYRSQWGSCSSNGVLSFHYKLSMLPVHLAEYVVVHELCHTVHFNHSKEYWDLVATFLPDPKGLRRELRTYLL